MPQPVAYLRRSRVDTRRPGIVSHEQQLTAVRTLATRHGDNPDALQIIEDWGRSGRAEKRHLRTGLDDLERMVKAGDVSAVYAYSLDRLGRSVPTLHTFVKLCADATPPVPVRCATGLDPDITNATGELVFTILAAIAAFQARWAAETAAERSATRKARGDFMGPAPYGHRVKGGQLVKRDSEDAQAVIDAYQRTGSMQATARLLTSQGTPSRTGRPWQASSVRGILEREHALPPSPKVGRRAPSTFRLGGLLRCPHDDAFLTGRHSSRGRPSIDYVCRKSAVDPTHPHPFSISEPKVLPWVKSEAAHFRVLEPVEMAYDNAEREALEAKRERWIEQYAEGLIDKAERDRRLDRITTDLDRLGAKASLRAVPTVNWSWSPADINLVLRYLWSSVHLGPDLLPLPYPEGFTWPVPEFRADFAETEGGPTSE